MDTTTYTDIPPVRTNVKQTAPATERNRQPILEVLNRYLPDSGTVLEVSSGTGEHVVHFARHHPALTWHPSDISSEALMSIDAWIAEEGLKNIRPAIRLNTQVHPWPVQKADALININMIHISPWESCENLFKGAQTLLSKGAPFFLYGPFLVEGKTTAESNVSFDQSLRHRNSKWGLRELKDVTVLAESHGFKTEEVVEMPANNLTIVFRRADDPPTV